MIYHPELGEKAAPRLFYSSHVHGVTYSINWLESQDVEAREQLAALRIRPRFGGPQREVPGNWSYATKLGAPVFHCMITALAHRKLLDADLCALLCLLD